MSDISGFDNEYEFVKYLNHKKVCELNPLFRNLIDSLFPNVKENFIIRSWRNHYKQKTDVFIKIDGKIKGISIKKGMKNSMHVERITDFIHFLIENHIDREIVIQYLKYHYADGSTNGKGSNRITVEEYKKENQSNIDKINIAFNNEKILKKAIDRFVIKGKNSNYYIDAIICGEVDDFVWIAKDDILNVILSKKDDYSTGVHFGSLSCQPKNRNLINNPKYEKDRYCVQIKWYNLFDEILENMNNKVLNILIKS